MVLRVWLIFYAIIHGPAYPEIKWGQPIVNQNCDRPDRVSDYCSLITGLGVSDLHSRRWTHAPETLNLHSFGNLGQNGRDRK